MSILLHAQDFTANSSRESCRDSQRTSFRQPYRPRHARLAREAPMTKRLFIGLCVLSCLVYLCVPRITQPTEDAQRPRVAAGSCGVCCRGQREPDIGSRREARVLDENADDPRRHTVDEGGWPHEDPRRSQPARTEQPPRTGMRRAPPSSSFAPTSKSNENYSAERSQSRRPQGPDADAYGRAGRSPSAGALRTRAQRPWRCPQALSSVDH